VSISIDDAKHVANLARLELSAAELKTYTAQLNDILKYAEQLQEINTDNVEPTYHALPLTNVMREDNVCEFSNRQRIIDNGPEVSGTNFIVPKIL
jgi:aspartyl-tRNA(Asn)/glutamyl-tRNA(Gln) amidotransferase subunit C